MVSIRFATLVLTIGLNLSDPLNGFRGMHTYIGIQLAIKAPPHEDAFCKHTNDRLPERSLSLCPQ